MTIQEILEAHQYEPTSYLVRIASCSCGDWADAAPAHLAKHFEGHRAHVAEVLEKHIRELEANAWDRAKAAVRGIPFWTDGTNHGFDICEDEEGLSHETGARIAVMRILDNNFYRKESSDGR